MYCKLCGMRTVVVDSVRQPLEVDGNVYRVRKCRKCGARIFTVETESAPDADKRLWSRHVRSYLKRRYWRNGSCARAELAYAVHEAPEASTGMENG